MFVIYIFLLWFLFTNCVIDDREGRQGSTNNLPKGLKSYPKKFCRLPYYENLQIVYLFDTMHIEKNITETLWKIFVSTVLWQYGNLLSSLKKTSIFWIFSIFMCSPVFATPGQIGVTLMVEKNKSGGINEVRFVSSVTPCKASA